MRSNRQITEVTGKPGKVWGNMFVPAKGEITVKIVDDVLHTTLKSGVERTNSWTRIQNIDFVEISETPEYALMAIGIFVLLTGLGSIFRNFVFGLLLLLIGGFIVYFSFVNKRRLLSIYSFRQVIPVFITKQPSLYQQFSETVLEVSRQLNSSSSQTHISSSTHQSKVVST